MLKKKFNIFLCVSAIEGEMLGIEVYSDVIQTLIPPMHIGQITVFNKPNNSSLEFVEILILYLTDPV